MQDERGRLQAVEFRLDGIEVFCAFCQDQHLASLRDGIAHLGGNGSCSGRIVGEVPEDVLNASIGRHVDPAEA